MKSSIFSIGGRREIPIRTGGDATLMLPGMAVFRDFTCPIFSSVRVIGFYGSRTFPADILHPRNATPVPSKSSSKPTPAITYADAGVDISSGDRTKQRIKYLAQRTFNKQVLSEIGGFGGLFKLDTTRYKNPVLVSSADGVGTKLKIAFQMNMHHTIGADLVNHCVNDIAVQAATPMFFMDYLASSKLDGDVAEKVVSGMADACRAN